MTDLQVESFSESYNELSRALLLSTGGIGNVVNRLAADGLVERESDPDGGRSSLIRLTAKGIKLAEETVPATSATHAELFAGVPETRLRAATRALRELSEARSTARRSPPRTSR